MRYSFDLPAQQETDSSRPSLTPKEDVQWVPLPSHPVFSSSSVADGRDSADSRSPRNLLAWDGTSRLYYWDPNRKCLHRLSVRLGEPEPTAVVAASPSKVLQADVAINFAVHKISINRDGSALLLSGLDGLRIMYLYGRNSSTKDNTIVCRTVSVGSRVYFDEKNVIRVLQVSWHPYSDTHLGILSSDSVFRLFNLSSDLHLPEQEFYLQPVEPGRCRNAASICPVDFSFGGDHLWDRFSVFILFNDGSIYVLCPVVPFGSVYKWEAVLEIHSDAQTSGMKSANLTAVSNSNLAISWLEATFPELANVAEADNLSVVKAHPYALFDASLCLQGPLHKVQNGREDEDLAVRAVECEGGAVGLLYDAVSKDSILVTAWSGGQLQIDALADEIQPVWTVGSPPRLHVNSHQNILGLAMICESISRVPSVVKLGQPLDHTVWLGHPPPLLRLAIVDLALPGKKGSGSRISMFVDPLMPERIYCLHSGGIDLIVLCFLPFTNQSFGKDEIVKSPSVHPVLSTCPSENTSLSPLCGFATMPDSFGYSWIAGVMSTQECIVLEMKTQNLSLPLNFDVEGESTRSEEWKEQSTSDLISKELLIGPNSQAPPAFPNLRSVAADSIEGRQALHRYYKMFHEKYVEYAHKVYFELKHHGPQLRRIIDEQQTRLEEAQEKLLQIEEKQLGLDERITRATNLHGLLEQRLQRLRNLPGAHKKPLSRAERDFKSELDQFSAVELDALRMSIDTLKARVRRYTQSLKGYALNQRRQIVGKKIVEDNQISQLRSAIEKLSLINNENAKKVKLVEHALKNQERKGMGPNHFASLV